MPSQQTYVRSNQEQRERIDKTGNGDDSEKNVDIEAVRVRSPFYFYSSSLAYLGVRIHLLVNISLFTNYKTIVFWVH